MNIDVLDLEEALEELGEYSFRQGKMMEMRFFVGLGLDEISTALGVYVPTVERDWTVARARLGHRRGRGLR